MKNWRTKDLIVRQELGINPGDTVTVGQLEKAVSRIWNIGNFAKVGYQLDTLDNSRITLSITAQDALTVMPDFSFSGNWQEFSLSAGINDENFLGRNIELNLAGTFGTLTKDVTLRLGIPRQLLYKNMTLRGGYTFAAVQNLKYEKGKAFSGVSYHKRNIFLTAGNPFHTDYHFTLSPDITVEYLAHATDSTLFRDNVIHPDHYRVRYLGFSLYESVGLINRIRHQRDGFLLGLTTAWYFGLDRESPGYSIVSLTGKYYRLWNRWVEFSWAFSTGITNARLSSQINYIGPDLIKGVLTGERWGKAYFSGGIRAGITYINRDWFAMEHSFFVFLGNATGKYKDLFEVKPLVSTGTGIKLMIPMVPWLAVSIVYAYKGRKNQWIGIE